MNSLDDLLTELNSRLPELEWKIKSLGTNISIHHLPRGLFKTRSEFCGQQYIDEIKADLKVLSQQNNKRCAHYVAEQIKSKVNVLVTLCQLDQKKPKSHGKEYFGLGMLSTRQQWMQSLEHEIATLVLQQKGMISTLEQMNKIKNTEAILALNSELGALEKRLTLAKETLSKANL